MKLKKLEICGFKSFPDKVVIAFPEGVSAVVGPNGCGKSNIVDAIRWVMGEQSVKQLRGKDKEDIIFAGTNGKAAVNMAEVSLTLANDTGSAPEEFRDFAEINITRRLYRSGETGFYINRQPCRLKDIHNVFLGSGMGARSYSIIQQGNIGAITDADPEKRRFFVEEAAGVTRYKNRKVEALRKVDATKQNLYRVSDIIKEVARQMNGLKKQAKTAELYKKYHDRILDMDVRVTVHHVETLTGEIKETHTLLTGLRDSDMAHSAELKKLDAAVESIKLKRWQKDQTISEQKSRQFEFQRRIDRSEGDLAHLKSDMERLTLEISQLDASKQILDEKNQGILTEISQAESEIVETQVQVDTVKGNAEQEEKVAQEVSRQLANLSQALEARKKELMELTSKEAQYQNAFQHATNTKESLKRRLRQADEQEALARRSVTDLENRSVKAKDILEEMKAELSDTNQQVTLAETHLKDTRTALGEQVKQYHTIEIDRKTCRSRYQALKKMEENFEWYKDGVKAIMTSAGNPEGDAACPPPCREAILGLMVDILEPKPSYETAVEAVLGESLQYILVENHGAGVDAIAYLQGTGAGRSGFIPVAEVKPAGEGRPSGGIAQEHRLLNFVDIKPGFETVACALLGHVAVVEDMAGAMALFNKNGTYQAVVTKGGDMVSPQGIMIGGSRDKLSGILQKKGELKELKERIDALDVEIEIAAKHQAELEARLREAESTLQQLLEKRNRIQREEMEAEKGLYKVGEELKHARHHLEVVSLEQEQLMGEQSDVDEQMGKFKAAIAQVQGTIQEKQREVLDASEQIDTVRMDVEEYRQRVVELRLKLSSLTATLENRKGSLKRLRDFQGDAVERLSSLAADLAQKRVRRTACEQKMDEFGKELSGMYAGIKALEKELQSNEAEYSAISSQLKNQDTTIAEIQSRREQMLQKIRIMEVEQSQKQMKLENTILRIEERYHRTFDELHKTLSEEGETAGMSPEKLEEELSKLRIRVERIGDVNLNAIKEYEQLTERHDFLTTQRDDLNKAIEDLHKVIRKINRITQDLFVETLQGINEKLKELFPRLFSGGFAELVLTEPDKPLESGVEFMINPPGKKLTRLSLLSGGEKALSAIAFIFSVFMMKPASFCLMDEIDAPLDDANVGRFNELLRFIGQKSQIVMITHNKQSMEFADMLFGITMEKKGCSKVVSVNLDREAA